MSNAVCLPLPFHEPVAKIAGPRIKSGETTCSGRSVGLSRQTGFGAGPALTLLAESPFA